MAYFEPLRVSIVGDEVAGARYVNTARRLAYELLRQIREAGVPSARRTFLDNAVGVKIEVVIADKIVAAVITVGAEKMPEFLPDDFVAWPRDTVYPDGVDFEFPQLILKAPKREGGQWGTFFKSAEIPAYEAFGHNPKGTYGARFPDGVRYAGNVDWRGKDGERVSWYGPERRYWAAPYLALSSQYGHYVFILGHKLLDLQAYEDGFPETYVMGAAIVGRFLYVVQADLPAIPPDGSSYPSSMRPYEVFFTPPFPTQSFTTRLVRYTITVDGAQQAPEAWSVAAGSHESLWDQEEEGWINPWFFNRDASRAVSVRNPANAMLKVYVGSSGEDTDSTYEFGDVEESNEIGELVNTAGDYALERQTQALDVLSAELQEAIVASDFDNNNERVDLYMGYEPFRGTFPVGAWALPIKWHTPAQWVSNADSLLMLEVRGYQPEYPREIYGTDNAKIPDWNTLFFRVGEFRLNLHRNTYTGESVIVHALDLRFGAFVLDRVQRIDRPQTDNPERIADQYYGTWRSTTEIWQAYTLSRSYEREPGNRPLDYNTEVDYMQYFAAKAGNTTIAPMLLIDSVTVVSGVASNTTSFPTVQQVEVREYSSKSKFVRTPAMFADPTQLFGVRVHYTLAGTPGAVASSYDANVEDLAPPFGPKFDFDGYAASQALAVIDGALLYGGLAFEYVSNPFGRGRLSVPVEHATGSTLPDITGVDGNERRYHPLWVLGQVPKSLSS